MKDVYTPYECIRLSQKFDQAYLDNIKDRVYAIKINGKLTWYINYVPDLYTVKYDFPLFDVKFLLFEILQHNETIINNIEGEYIIRFKHYTYSSYNLKDLLYKIIILNLETKTKPDI